MTTTTNNSQPWTLGLGLSLVERHRQGVESKRGGVACIEQGNSESGVAVMVVLDQGGHCFKEATAF